MHCLEEKAQASRAGVLGRGSEAECTKIARFSAVAAAILTAPPQNRVIFKAPRCAISSAKKIASEPRFSLRLKGTNLIPTAEIPAIPESAAKIASERRCAILVHSVQRWPPHRKRWNYLRNDVQNSGQCFLQQSFP